MVKTQKEPRQPKPAGPSKRRERGGRADGYREQGSSGEGVSQELTGKV